MDSKTQELVDVLRYSDLIYPTVSKAADTIEVLSAKNDSMIEQIKKSTETMLLQSTALAHAITRIKNLEAANDTRKEKDA